MKYDVRLRNLNMVMPILTENTGFVQVSNEKTAILCRIKAVIADFTQYTENGTYYSLELWEKLLTNDRIKNALSNNSFCMEIDHPDDKSGRVESWFKNTAGVIRSLEIDKQNGVINAVIDVLNVPAGQIIHTMILAKVGLGFSLRGVGDVDKDGIVNPDTFNLIGIDFVVEPSNVRARITNIIQTESNETINVPVSELITTRNSITNLVENYNKLQNIDNSNKNINIIKEMYKEHILNSEVESMKKTLKESFDEILAKKLKENALPDLEKGNKHTESEDENKQTENDDQKKIEEQMTAVFRSNFATAVAPFFSAMLEALDQQQTESEEEKKQTESEEEKKQTESEEEKKQTESEEEKKQTESEEEKKMQEQNDFENDLDKIALGGSDEIQTIGDLSIVPDPPTKQGVDIDTVNQSSEMDDTIVIEESITVDPLEENEENEEDKQTENEENEEDKQTENEDDKDDVITERARFIKNQKYNGKHPETFKRVTESNHINNNNNKNTKVTENSLYQSLQEGKRW